MIIIFYGENKSQFKKKYWKNKSLLIYETKRK